MSRGKLVSISMAEQNTNVADFTKTLVKIYFSK